LVILALLLILGALAGTLGLVAGDALGLALLVRGGFGGSLGLGLGGLAFLFTLYLGILGGIPRLEHLRVTCWSARTRRRWRTGVADLHRYHLPRHRTDGGGRQ